MKKVKLLGNYMVRRVERFQDEIIEMADDQAEIFVKNGYAEYVMENAQTVIHDITTQPVPKASEPIVSEVEITKKTRKPKGAK
jgi:hypothetical protein